MKIDEALNGLQGLNNNGGEMPRVKKAKKIEKIVSGKKHKNFKKPKGPLSIDLSKLGEDEVENNDPILNKLKEKYASKKYAKTSDKNTMKVKPTTGHESPNKMRGKMVGEAPEDSGMYNQRQTTAAIDQSNAGKNIRHMSSKNIRQTTAAMAQSKRDSARGQNIVFNHEEFRKFMVQNHPNKTYAAVEQNLVKYQMEFQNAQSKAKAEKELNKPKQDFSKYDEPAYKRRAPMNTKVSRNPINSPITRANHRNTMKDDPRNEIS